MKIYEYSFDVNYGSGIGIVFAKNKDNALKLIKENDGYYIKGEEITLEEIVIKNELVISHSWTE